MQASEFFEPTVYYAIHSRYVSPEFSVVPDAISVETCLYSRVQSLVPNSICPGWMLRERGASNLQDLSTVCLSTIRCIYCISDFYILQTVPNQQIVDSNPCQPVTSLV
eukprot:COSAG02_NODE_3954_length_5988_cov_32.465104_2_plen_108_part_00